jgi:hypothetical protein
LTKPQLILWLSADNAQKIDQISSQQLSRFTQLENAMEGLLEALDQNTSKVGNTSNIAQSLLDLTQTLGDLIGHFKIDNSCVIDINQPEGDDRREHPRTESHFLVRVEIDGKWEDAYYENISLTGMKVLLNHEIEIDNNVHVSVLLPKQELAEYREQKPMRLTGSVKRISLNNNGFVYGVEYIDAKQGQLDQLEQAINFISCAA